LQLSLEEHVVTVDELRPMPAPVRVLRVVLLVQAGVWALGTLVGLVAYFLGPGDPSLTWYGRLRTYPLTAVVIGAAVVVVLVWFIRRLPAGPFGLRRCIREVETLLLVDAAVALVAGIFNVWLVLGVLAAIAALVYLSADETEDFLV
jgi:hypothetical protein